MDINTLFDYSKLSKVNNAEFSDSNINFKFSTLKPNCDMENYTIESDNFLFEIGTLNTMRKTDVFIKIQPDMNFDGIDTKVMHVKGLKVIKDNEVKFDGPWINIIEKEASHMSDFA